MGRKWWYKRPPAQSLGENVRSLKVGLYIGIETGSSFFPYGSHCLFFVKISVARVTSGEVEQETVELPHAGESRQKPIYPLPPGVSQGWEDQIIII